MVGVFLANRSAPVLAGALRRPEDATPPSTRRSRVSGTRHPIDVRGRRLVLVSKAVAVEEACDHLGLAAGGEGEAARRTGAAYKTRYAWTKRTLDVVVALAVGLIALPLVPLVALAIRLDSLGPAIYSQIRVGYRGRPFRIYKFRSMCQDAERCGAVWAQVGDPRVTRVGRFMRLTRLDELPQVWNVLRGEMTLVGPRPERPEFTTRLERELPGYANRHAVKPGLTGWAQVRYRYASTLEETQVAVAYDLDYVERASLAFDLEILLRTIPVVIGMRGC